MEKNTFFLIISISCLKLHNVLPFTYTVAVLAKKEPRTDFTFRGWGTLSSIINVGLKKSEIYYYSKI